MSNENRKWVTKIAYYDDNLLHSSSLSLNGHESVTQMVDFNINRLFNTICIM